MLHVTCFGCSVVCVACVFRMLVFDLFLVCTSTHRCAASVGTTRRTAVQTQLGDIHVASTYYHVVAYHVAHDRIANTLVGVCSIERDHTTAYHIITPRDVPRHHIQFHRAAFHRVFASRRDVSRRSATRCRATRHGV